MKAGEVIARWSSRAPSESFDSTAYRFETNAHTAFESCCLYVPFTFFMQILKMFCSITNNPKFNDNYWYLIIKQWAWNIRIFIEISWIFMLKFELLKNIHELQKNDEILINEKLEFLIYCGRLIKQKKVGLEQHWGEIEKKEKKLSCSYFYWKHLSFQWTPVSSGNRRFQENTWKKLFLLF